MGGSSTSSVESRYQGQADPFRYICVKAFRVFYTTEDDCHPSLSLEIPALENEKPCLQKKKSCFVKHLSQHLNSTLFPISSFILQSPIKILCVLDLPDH